jgi:hypothetical protein
MVVAKTLGEGARALERAGDREEEVDLPAGGKQKRGRFTRRREIGKRTVHAPVEKREEDGLHAFPRTAGRAPAVMTVGGGDLLAKRRRAIARLLWSCRMHFD